MLSTSRRSFMKGMGALGGLAAVGGASLPSIASAASGAVSANKNPDVRYVKTLCCHCVNFCGQNIKVEKGVIRAVYPNPEIAEYYNHGICPKGVSGMFNTYNPYRIKKPLKRTNPNKGINEDPQWAEIEWEEAFATISEKLSKIKAEDPRKLIWHHGHGKYLIQDGFPKAFAAAFGTPNVVHRTTTCEAARHVADEMTWGYHGFLPDVEQCQTLVLFGASIFEGEQWARWLDHAITDAKARGMKFIVVEPRLSNTAAKSDEWIAVRPGTDVTMILAMCKVLMDEGTFDKAFLINYTNAPHLVGDDGKILRNDKNEPLVWDNAKKTAAPLADGMDVALTGSFKVKGKTYRPSMQVLADQLKDHSAAKAEQICGVPAARIESLARELAETARIGATVMVDGQPTRYRPVAIHTFRGLSAKEFGVQNWRSGLLLQMLLGNLDAVGGLHLHGVYKKPGYLEASKCEYPPNRVDLQESIYFPHATHNVCQQVAHTLLDPKAYGLDYVPEMQIFYATNRPMSTSDPLKQFEAYAKTYNVVIDLVQTELAQMADIVLPDLTYLESWHFAPTRWTPNSKHVAIRQPLTNAYNLPHDGWSIIWELAKRLGIRDKYVEGINKKFKLGKKGPKMETGRDYTPREAVEILWANNSDKPFDYAIEHGIKGKHVDAAHRYLEGVEKQFKGVGKPKMHFYAEQLIDSFAKIEKTVKEKKVKNLDLKYYKMALSPLPLVAHASPKPHLEAKGYPFYLVTHKRMYRTQAGNTSTNPILNRLGDSDENFIVINPTAAKELGIADGDLVVVESRIGKAQGKARYSEGVRPDTLAVSYHYGHFAKGLPDYAKKGVWINQVMELHSDVVSGMNSFNDTKCKVYKA